ncbi:N-acetylglucosamine-6-phosphate deacetylase [Hazenella sp. IB182357]|uniref:N-acetylglucosamine-6-phosphate deacetylase n=1 Tax=Polycladospora coralii TaxID=2771432 RepID=A0A926NC98_9BACL|nr:N-acetylglucosamine-6-phosphate deacetylase [Polycladospora coralii]MBD1370944.1 N-acetylglucosamine-6-phosphate deacetylase [Polycladospora coralii]MBS7529883.1 N-acetylglucosamine-6-phosphate deacetylase [Polycladospora coralii]
MAYLNSFSLVNGEIYAEERWIPHGFVRVNAGKIVSVGSMSEYDRAPYETVIEIPVRAKVVPGFIDVHLHGVAGSDFMDGTQLSLHTISEALPEEGTTSFLATTLSQSPAMIERAMVHIRQWMTQSNFKGAQCLGLHLEGPFLHPQKAGAQPVQWLTTPDLSLIRKWQKMAQGAIKIVTLAPELEGGMTLIRMLTQMGIKVSIGHSNATYQEAMFALNCGASHITHLYNQMSGLHHRDPGIVGAAFWHPNCTVELIVDGIHVCKEMVQLAYQQITSERLICITDAMRGKKQAPGMYDLAGQQVQVKGKQAMLPDGTLAGSLLSMNEALRSLYQMTGCSLSDVIHTATRNPAQMLGIYGRKGSIKVGKDGDLVIMNENFDILATFIMGKEIYTKNQ